tara:strand:+ start:221 stop:355 length:135 start_codon:yes stop_codon:yes gene_type:complete
MMIEMDPIQPSIALFQGALFRDSPLQEDLTAAYFSFFGNFFDCF